MGLFFIGTIVLPARFGVRVLRINARYVSGIIKIEALDVLCLGANESRLPVRCFDDCAGYGDGKACAASARLRPIPRPIRY